MRLYSMAGTCATAVHIALEWSQAPYEVQILSRGDQNKLDYLAINPLGSVPAMVLDDGSIVTEAQALLQYVDRLSDDRFAPANSPLRDIRLAELLSFLNSEIHAAFKPHFAPFRVHPEESEHSVIKRVAYDRIRRLMDLLDDRFSAPFFFGEERSVADPYIFVLTRWLHSTPVKLEEFPKLRAFSGAMHDDDTVKSVLADYG